MIRLIVRVRAGVIGVELGGLLRARRVRVGAHRLARVPVSAGHRLVQGGFLGGGGHCCTPTAVNDQTPSDAAPVVDAYRLATNVVAVMLPITRIRNVPPTKFPDAPTKRMPGPTVTV